MSRRGLLCSSKVREHILQLCSSFCLFLLLVPSFGILRFSLLYFLFTFVAFKALPKFTSWKQWSKKGRIALILISIALIMVFHFNWYDYVLRLSDHNHLISNLSVLFIGVCLLLGAFPFLSSTFNLIMNFGGTNKTNALDNTTSSLRYDTIWIPLLTSIIVITICSCFSPLYAINTWCSPACYHTVGKSIWSGLIPYKDLYEHKGPLVYALYSIASLISFRSFLGMYILSIPFTFTFFYFSRKSIRLLTNKAIDPWFIIVGTAIYCTFSYFSGGSVEELLLPFLSYALYLAVKYVLRIEQNKLQDSKLLSVTMTNSISSWGNCFFLGISIAVVFWTKFNIMAFFIGYFLYLICYTISRKRTKDFINSLMPISIGFLSLTLLICLFYAHFDALDDLIRVYFHDNLFLYMEPSPIISFLGYNPVSAFFYVVGMHIKDNSFFFLAIFLAWLWLRRNSSSISLLFLLTLSFTALFIFIKPDYFKYYSFILAVFVPFSVLPLSNIKWKHYNKRLSLLSATVVLSLLVWGSDNIKKMRLDKDDYIQFRFAKTIMKEPNPTLLNYYCQDQCLFMTTGIIPTTKYYCDFNNQLPDIHLAHDSIVNNREVEFIVTFWKKEFAGYEIVDQAMCPVKGVMFYLYKRK